MINIQAPGSSDLAIEHVVLDYNGTIALDGILDYDSSLLINRVSKLAHVAVLTCDTCDTIEKYRDELNAEVVICPSEGSSLFKEEYVKGLSGQVCCLGNGLNDVGMFQQADLAIAIIGEEGACGKLLEHADVVVRSGTEGLALLVHPNRTKATLRS